ncbi:hypothetical protein D3227_00655 [Mesorhizobium waimense]|uniref:Uncharacterized protein n=1 Tax=Mesorhizobium waimense TaxID=1300307 RepID=A0A3A5L684_9HYPH|nr:hypothetical protein [Mesorhizobium waimense]RJT42418.1 hypothetical protein D3227_00655 [Mesorhizobium waimense]
MATRTKKPAKGRSVQPRATQAKAGAGPAIAERSKDAKPAFGKAPPKKVVPGVAAKVTAKTSTAKTSKPKKPAAGSGSAAGRAMRTAAGAVVATARGAASLAASVIGRGGSKAKAK